MYYLFPVPVDSQTVVVSAAAARLFKKPALLISAS
jgi:hypothetical protein